jgi:nitrogen regulatory protein P-II 1
MKLIIAYIRPELIQEVKLKLYAVEIFSMSVTNVLGSGRQKGYTESYRGVQTEVNLLRKVRLEIGVPEEKLEDALSAITEGAKTGQTGDGVIFVMDTVMTRRIRTGEVI